MIGAIFITVTLGTIWQQAVGSGIEASTLTRVFQPLIVACILANLLEPPMGAFHRTCPRSTSLECIALTLILVIVFVMLIILQTGMSEVTALTIRNLFAFMGITALISYVVGPIYVWIPLVPFFTTTFLFESSRFPNIWPNIIWAWPNSVTSDQQANQVAIALGVFGLLRLALLHGSTTCLLGRYLR